MLKIQSESYSKSWSLGLARSFPMPADNYLYQQRRGLAKISNTVNKWNLKNHWSHVLDANRQHHLSNSVWATVDWLISAEENMHFLFIQLPVRYWSPERHKQALSPCLINYSLITQSGETLEILYPLHYPKTLEAFEKKLIRLYWSGPRIIVQAR